MTKSDVWGIVFGIPVMLAFTTLWVLTLLNIGIFAESTWGSFIALGLMILQAFIILGPVHRLLTREKHTTFEWVDKK